MALAFQKEEQNTGIWVMKIYLATWLLEPNQGTVLSTIGKRERLISYFHTLEKKDQLAQYVKTGRNDENISSNNRSRK